MRWVNVRMERDVYIELLKYRNRLQVHHDSFGGQGEFQAKPFKHTISSVVRELLGQRQDHADRAKKAKKSKKYAGKQLVSPFEESTGKEVLVEHARSPAG